MCGGAFDDEAERSRHLQSFLINKQGCAMSADSVRRASSQFYTALNKMVNGDAKPMAEIWAHDDEVTTMHPVGSREVGWNAVKASWEGIAEISSEGEVSLKDQQIRVVGDVAYEVGVEDVTATLSGETVHSEVRVTNIYRRADGTWKMVHHHTDLDPAMEDILARV